MGLLEDRRRAIAEGLLGTTLPAGPQMEPEVGFLQAWGENAGDRLGFLASLLDPMTWYRAVGSLPPPDSPEARGSLGSLEDMYNLVANVAPFGITTKYGGTRPAMLKARGEELRARKAQSAGAERTAGVEEIEAALAKKAQKKINIATTLDEPLPALDTMGYDLFDYSKLGEGVGERYSLVRPQPRGNKFEALPERIKSLVSDPYVYENTKKAALRGRDFWNWYDIRPYADALMSEGMTLDELGRYIRYQQAAAQNIRPDVQKRIGNYLWSLDKHEQLTPDAPMFYPKGYGSKAQKNIWENALAIKRGDPITTEKLASYGENFGGGLLLGGHSGNLQPNWAPGTMDTHGVRLPAMLSHNPSFLAQGIREKAAPGFDPNKWENVRFNNDFIDYSPRETFRAGRYPLGEALKRPGHWYSVPGGSDYAAIEQYLYKPIAEELGVPTASVQAGTWIGGGGITGLGSPPKLMLQMYEDEIKRLAHENNITPAQVIRRLAQGAIY
jgi:hypothetical protein